jgi:hypothetical protein
MNRTRARPQGKGARFFLYIVGCFVAKLRQS